MGARKRTPRRTCPPFTFLAGPVRFAAGERVTDSETGLPATVTDCYLIADAEGRPDERLTVLYDIPPRVPPSPAARFRRLSRTERA